MKIALIGYLYERRAFSLYTQNLLRGGGLMPLTPHESSPAWVSPSVEQNGIGSADGTCRRKPITGCPDFDNRHVFVSCHCAQRPELPYGAFGTLWGEALSFLPAPPRPSLLPGARKPIRSGMQVVLGGRKRGRLEV